MSVYTRVTTVLSPFTGYKKVPSHILQNAADRGTRVHDWINHHINVVPLFDFQFKEEKEKNYVDSFCQFWEEKKGLEIVLTEERMYCDQLMITGACDLVAKFNEKLILIDWKTSYKENKTWSLQASAYKHLLKTRGYNVDEVWFVKLDRDSNPAQVFIYEDDFETFLKCYDIYNKFFKNEELQDYE